MRSDNLKERYTRLIKTSSKQLGFDFCGVSKADFLEEEAQHLEKWLSQKRHGEMTYMENYFDKRVDVTKLMPGAKSVVSLLLNYYPKKTQADESAPKISRYAYGEDYHFVIKSKLKELLKIIYEEVGDVNGRCFVDSAPVMDKAWAKRSGLGWIGKHTNLINKEHGSYFFIAELILDLELEYDGPIKDYCGTCTSCIEACPTDAITAPYEIDGSKCISYLTIELKNSIPQEFKEKMDNWVFGCDICQEVCPWNRFSKSHNEPLFNPHPDLLGMKGEEWHEITEEVFKEMFKRSAVKRTKFEGLRRNLNFLNL